MSRRFGRLMTAVGTLTAGLLGGLEATAGPTGPEFRVSASSSGDQIGPVVVKDGSGNSIVVWEGDGQADTSTSGVFFRKFNPAGVPVTGEILANFTVPGLQAGGDVDVDVNGNFVLMWEGAGAGDTLGVFGRRFNANGVPISTEFRVNNTTTGDQAGPGIGMAPDGSFVVAWEGAGPGDSLGVFARRFNADATPQADEFLVNSWTNGEQAGPSLVADSGGGLVVVWESSGQVPDANGFGVFARRFDANGPLGAEFLVNTAKVGDQAGPDIDADANGKMIVVWESFGQDGDKWGVYGQHFDPMGTPIGSEFRVNTYTAGDQAGPDVDIDPSGRFVVTWDSSSQDSGGNYGVYAKRYDVGAVVGGSEFRVNTTIPGAQLGPGIETDANGDVIIVWEGKGTGDDVGIFAQRLEFTPPNTTITSGPDPDTAATSASFTFTSNEAGSTFQCALDAGAFASCTSPKSYSGLSLGAHSFQVKATDSAGNTDPTPAVWAWGVLDSTAPSVALVTPASGRVYFYGAEVASQTGYTIVVGPIILVGEARDAESGIDAFLFEIDGRGFAPTNDVVKPDGTHTYSFTWNPSGVPGAHAIRVWATNGDRLLAASPFRQVTLAASV